MMIRSTSSDRTPAGRAAARSLSVVVALVTLTVLPLAELAAQRPQTRTGFWISFGLGGGNLGWECDGCPSEDHGGPTGFLRLGGATSQKVLLGAEINVWAVDIGATEIAAGYTAFTVSWYPSATAGFFVKGGVGINAYLRGSGSSDTTSTGAATLLGAGYDIRVARNFSISPMATLWWSSKSDLQRDNVTLETGFRSGGAALQLGFTFH